MKAELKAKFLQHLNQKKQDQGFTLIELLVVIIIIGILSAIALPSFLNQASKAKQSEAKTTMGTVNSAQTTYRNESGRFAANMNELALGLPSATNNYTYTISGGVDTASIATVNSDTALKNYVGGNARYTGADSQSAIATIACEKTAPGAVATAVDLSSKLVTTATTAETAVACPTDYKRL